jgi:hypothetical protein
MNYYLPHNLDIDTIIYNQRPSFNPFKKDKLIYILSLINSLRVSNKDLLFDSYTPMNSTLLQDRVANYRDYLNYLIDDLKIIEINNKYVVGKKSRGYRFVNKYQTMVKPYVVSDFVLRKKMKVEINNAMLTVKKLKYLTKYFNKNLTIDFKKCQEYLKEVYEIKMLNPELKDYDMIKDKFKFPIHQFNRSLISVNNIDNGCFYLKRDSNVNRFHSNLTNINSVLRNAISYKGEKLVSIDITNSQPYLSSILLTKEFWNKDYRIDNIFNIYNFNSFYINYYIMLGESPVSTMDKGFGGYVEFVSEGRLYEYLRDEFNKELGFGTFDREQTKIAVFQALFTSNTFLGQKKALPKKMFAKIFPDVYEVFKKIKKKDKSILPRLLQSIESLLVIDIICKRISEELPDAPIFTIHDSVTTTHKYLDDVKRIMLEECEKNVGFTPKLKIENWDIENMNLELNKLKNRVSELEQNKMIA